LDCVLLNDEGFNLKELEGYKRSIAAAVSAIALNHHHKRISKKYGVLPRTQSSFKKAIKDIECIDIIHRFEASVFGCSGTNRPQLQLQL
jgi:hypothetical protein